MRRARRAPERESAVWRVGIAVCWVCVVLIVVLAVLWIVTGMEGILLEVAAASTLLAMQVQLACWSLLHSRDRDEDE